MAKKKINKFVFESGISKDDNLFPKAYSLLIANKSFLQAQVVAFINNQIANEISPYDNYSYASDKCIRDVGFFLDAIFHDVRYGGNVKIREVSDYFWIDGRPQIRGNPAPEITGQAYIRDIINNFIFTNTPVSPTYGQTAVPQVFIVGNNAEENASSRITAEFAILASVIENGITAIPPKITGVCSARLLGKFDSSDILLITNTENGEILYNFADPATSISIIYKTGRSSGDGNPLSDVDFRSWFQTTDTITTIYFSKSTINTTSDKIQIFVEDDVTTIKPWLFGTDAIERMRVAAPQAMLDADFEYGLQPTKWQQIALQRSYPSIYEIPGTDLEVISVSTDASVDTADFGSSLITVVTSSVHNLEVGQPITIKGLKTNVQGFSRAQGSFLVNSVPSPTTITYYASARVGNSTGESLFTNNIQLRQAGFYTGSNIGTPTFSVESQGSFSSIDTVFEVSVGSDRIPFVGPTPSSGSPISGTPSIPVGTSISGVTGTQEITVTILEDTTPGQTFITIVNTAGILPNMVIDNGTGIARNITSILGNRLNLDGTFDLSLSGNDFTFTDIFGNLTQSIGTNAAFDVAKEDGTYALTSREDSTANGENFRPGDRVRILGTQVGGSSPLNDITITITQVDSQGSIEDFTFTGTASSGTDQFVARLASTLTNAGNGARFTVRRLVGSYIVSITLAGNQYVVGNILTVPGTDLGGTSPLNDLEIQVDGVNSNGGITSILTSGIGTVGDTIIVYPTLTISEITTGIIPGATTLSTGEIATIEVEFTSNHGLIPGASILVDVTSVPPPGFVSTPRVKASSTTSTRVAYASGVFIAVANGSANTQISLDGINWTNGGNLPASANWTSIAGGDVGGTTYFVAVRSGSNDAAWSNNFGQTWTSVTLPVLTTTTWTEIAYHNGRFVAVRSGSNGSAFSTNGGQTWTASTLPGSNLVWQTVAGGTIDNIDYFVALASGTTSGAAWSIDGGVTWFSSATPSATWRCVIFGNGRFVAAATGGSVAITSTNGISWTSQELPSSSTWQNIAFGNGQFVLLNTTTSALTSPLGITGTWIENTISNGTWGGVTFGLVDDAPGFVAVGSGTNALDIELTPANHDLASGPFIVTSVPTPTTLRFPAKAQGIINETVVSISGFVYSRPDAFFEHRPFDGGVQLGTGGPQHGAQAIRQSKKYIRYQSGKGIMYTTGALFAPSYSLASATANGTAVNSVITFVTDDTDHGLQPGCEIEVTGMYSFEYNGNFIVESVKDTRTFRVRSAVNLSTTTAILGEDAKVITVKWHGATVRAGAFDDQNGIFFQYDGQKLAVVKRSSTFQLAGSVSILSNDNLVVGEGTRFLDQLVVGDKVVIKGMSHTVTSIIDQETMTFSPDYRGVRDLVGGKMVKTVDLIIPQEDWNLDTLDGTGPSGYNVNPSKMQMIGMQYTWYAVGFIEFMLRGPDGKFVFLHRIRNSNVNTEAYMRTANLPVRYEVDNTGAKSYLIESIDDSQTSLKVANSYYFPDSGVVYVGNELISYTGKANGSLINLTRASTFGNFSAGQNRIYSAGPAVSHNEGEGVILVSCTISPAISHWGSAMLTDGLFDEDRGYLFNYAATGISVSTVRQTALFIRLAPSVSNALIGDLGDRDLLNRAQLLLQEISITANPQSATDSGGIIVEGVINPQNYPTNPENIVWTTLNNSGAGGQPSFAQVASGGSVNWGTTVTTATATVQGAVTASFNAQPVLGNSRSFSSGISRFYLLQTDADNSGLQVGDVCTSRFPTNTTITNIINNVLIGPTLYAEYTTSAGATSNVNGVASIGIRASQTAASYTRTNFLFFTLPTFLASAAGVGTRVDAASTTFPAGTTITSVVQRKLGTTLFYRVGFTQSSNATINAGATITFAFGFDYALPGEQIFSFIANPGERSSLDLSELKELTTTAIGGRGSFPNGPDVLAINVYKVSGPAVSANVILRWSEAQA